MLTAIKKYRSEIVYGSVLAFLIFLLKWMEYRFVLFSSSIEIYMSLIALFFMGLGIWVAYQLIRRKEKTIIIEKEVVRKEVTVDPAEAEKIGLSSRELDVLKLIAEGFSNQEIADKLFVSANTIKTHSSRIFEKLDVKRRTQAVEKARRLNIIA